MFGFLNLVDLEYLLIAVNEKELGQTIKGGSGIREENEGNEFGN